MICPQKRQPSTRRPRKVLLPPAGPDSIFLFSASVFLQASLLQIEIIVFFLSQHHYLRCFCRFFLPHPRINSLVDDLCRHIAQNHNDSGHQAKQHQKIVIFVPCALIRQRSDTGIRENRFYNIGSPSTCGTEMAMMPRYDGIVFRRQCRNRTVFRFSPWLLPESTYSSALHPEFYCGSCMRNTTNDSALRPSSAGSDDRHGQKNLPVFQQSRHRNSAAI